MFDPAAIQLAQARRGSGLYESYYFRGTSVDGRTALWLKHNLLRRSGSKQVTVMATVVAFDRKTGEAKCTYDMDEISLLSFQQFAKNGSWEDAAFNFASGSFFEIADDHLRGKLHTPRGSASWELNLAPSGETFFHFPNERLYRLPLPRHKLLTRDCRVRISGRLSCAGMVLSGEFVGICGHNWGSSHASEYAYAECNAFREDEEAFFDGFSARMSVAAGLLHTPYLSMAALKADGQWHYFNRVLAAPRQAVDAIDNYRWLATLHNETHRLEIAIDGANPRVEPWIALNYEHPNGQRSVVKNTKFAAGKLRLYEKHAQLPQCELSSEFFELETLLPRNVPTSKSYLGEA